MSWRLVFHDHYTATDPAVLGAWFVAFAVFAVFAYRRSAGRRDV